MAPAQWALVTGVSAGGMGEGHVRAFLERGISVFATSIDIKLLEDCKFSNGKNQASTIFLQLDVTSQDSINAAVKQVESITAGRLDFLMSTQPEHPTKHILLLVWLTRDCRQRWFWLFNASAGC